MEIKFTADNQVFDCYGRALNQSYIDIYVNGRHLGWIRRTGKRYKVELSSKTYNFAYTETANSVDEAKQKALDIINNGYDESTGSLPDKS